MTIEARRALRGVSGALLALALVLLAAVPVAQADTIYPDNKITGTSFDAGLDGWTEFSNQCFLVDLGGNPLLDLGAPTPLCAPHTEHSAGHGTPPGSLEQNSEQTASAAVGSLLGVIRGQATALSPVFTVPTGGDATFTVDRRFTLEALLPLGLFDEPARFNYNFWLVDEASPLTPLILDGDTVDVTRNQDPPFSGHGPIDLPAGSVLSGHSYRIKVTTTFRANPQLLSAIAAVYTARAQYDNVRLQVKDGSPTFVSPPTAITDPATDIACTPATPPALPTCSATLNGRTNAHGVPSTYTFSYGETADLTGADTTTIGPFNAGERITLEERSRSVAGLKTCTTYYFQIEARNQFNQPPAASSKGGILSFKTHCAPDATTDVATGVGPNAATLNSIINPNGLETTYHYEYRVKGTARRGPPRRTGPCRRVLPRWRRTPPRSAAW